MMFKCAVYTTMCMHLKIVCVFWWHFYIYSTWGAQCHWWTETVLRFWTVIYTVQHCANTTGNFTVVLWVCDWVKVVSCLSVRAHCLRENIWISNGLTPKTPGVICNWHEVWCAYTLVPIQLRLDTDYVPNTPAVPIRYAVTSNFCNIKVVMLLF
jgi:hypothetical protein